MNFDLSRVTQLKPDNVENYLILSKMRLKIGDLSESIKSLKECLRSDPDQKQCKVEYRKLKNIQKKLDKVQDSISKSKFITVKDMLIKENLISEIEKLDSQILNGQVYGYACTVFSHVMFLDFNQIVEKK